MTAIYLDTNGDGKYEPVSAITLDKGYNISNINNIPSNLYTQEKALEQIGAGQNNQWTIVIAGQSNGLGTGNMPASSQSSIPGAKVYSKDGKYRVLSEPSHWLYPGYIDNFTPYGGTYAQPNYSMATSLANNLKELTGADILIVPCAIGGTSALQWIDQAYVDPPVQTSLFGQMRSRIDAVTGKDYSRLIIIHHGHENGSDAPTSQVLSDTQNLIAAYRYWFGLSVPIIFPQLATDTVSNNATLYTAMANAGNVIRSLDQDYGIPTYPALTAPPTNLTYVNADNIATFNNGQAAAVNSGSWLIAGTNSTNFLADIPGGVHYHGDNTSNVLAIQLKPSSVGLVKNRWYQLTMRVANIGAGHFHLQVNNGYPTVGANFQFSKDGVAQGGSPTGQQDGLYVFTWLQTGYNYFSLFRSTGESTTDFDITQMSIKSGQKSGIFTYPTWDLQNNGGPDGIHLNAAGQDENGRRAALVIAKRVALLPNLTSTNASGAPVQHTGFPFLLNARQVAGSTTVISLFFDQTITAVGDTTNYIVENASNAAQTINSVAINGGDPTRVDITIASGVTAGTAKVSYFVKAGNEDGTGFTNFLTTSEGLPPVRFYRVTCAAT